MMAVSHVMAHVPSFGTALDASCVTPLHVDDAKISQVAYFQTDPGYMNGVMISEHEAETALESDIGLVLEASVRHSDAAKYVELFVGCLPSSKINTAEVCRDSVSNKTTLSKLLKINSTTAISKQQGKIEPFTQSVYRQIASKTLYEHESGCEERGYAIVLRVDKNAPGPVLWSAVVGKAETFSLYQLLSFPIFIAKIHGSYGNNHYRFHLIALFAALVSLLVYLGLKSDRIDSGSSHKRRARTFAWLAIMAFSVVLLDQSLHFADSAHETDMESLTHALPLFALLVILLANVVPILTCLFFIRYHNRHENVEDSSRYGYRSVNVGLYTMLCIYAASVLFIGDIATLFTVASVLIIAIVLGVKNRNRSDRISFGAHAVACFGIILLIFIGSGYWLGPLLLIAMAVSTIAHD